MPHARRAALLVCVSLAAPAPASAVAYSFSGTIDTVTDVHDYLDGTVVPDAVVSGTYEVDPTTADTSSPFGVGPASLSFQLGGYRFAASQSSHAIALIDDHVVATDPFLVTDDIWRPLAMVISDLSPGSNVSTHSAGYAALVEFFDFDSAAFDGSETAPIVPGALAAPWEFVRLTLNSVDGSSNIDGFLQVQVNITSWALVPEPRSAALLAFGLASLAVRARRRAQMRQRGRGPILPAR